MYQAIFIIAMLMAVCNSAMDASAQQSVMQIHGGSATGDSVKFIDVLKKQVLANYPSATIGEAFDRYRYFSRVDWKEFPEPDGKIYFDFTGALKPKMFSFTSGSNDTAVQFLQVKFLVDPTGAFGVVMATRVDLKKNGTVERTALPQMKPVLDRIYSNEEIRF